MNLLNLKIQAAVSDLIEVAGERPEWADQLQITVYWNDREGVERVFSSRQRAAIESDPGAPVPVVSRYMGSVNIDLPEEVKDGD